MVKHTGYLTIDHRASPGIPGSKHLGEGTLFEADTRMCGHCSVPVVLNPYRTRERGFCPKCNSYLCDPCHIGYHLNGVCKPFAQVIEEVTSGKVPVVIRAKDVKG